MADKTVDGAYLFFYDNWPGRVYRQNALADFYTATNHNVATDVCGVGTKVEVWNPGSSLGRAGWSVFIYLKNGATAPGVAVAAKSILCPDLATDVYVVTNDPNDCLSMGEGLACVAPSAMTASYYGWYLCGGVVPSDLIPAMDGSFATDDAVVAGDFTTATLAVDAIGLSILTATTTAVGYSMLADA